MKVTNAERRRRVEDFEEGDLVVDRYGQPFTVNYRRTYWIEDEGGDRGLLAYPYTGLSLLEADRGGEDIARLSHPLDDQFPFRVVFRAGETTDLFVE